jgi:hypothetical protein
LTALPPQPDRSEAEGPTPAPRHLPGLPAVPTIATPGFRKTQTVAADAVELREIALIAGNPGARQDVPTYSPFFARADRQLLLRVDETYAHGVFRRWARVLQVGGRLATAAGTDRLTLKVARATLARLKTEAA